jgi:probable rRNA maturation factor
MIRFHTEGVSFSLKDKKNTLQWLKKVIEKEGFTLGELNYIFCSDEYLNEVNVQYLNHDTYTDIITFDNSEEPDKIEGDIFISTERVEENARTLQLPFEQELRRVLVHGVLHLCGHNDETDEEESAMRIRENLYLSL